MSHYDLIEQELAKGNQLAQKIHNEKYSQLQKIVGLS